MVAAADIYLWVPHPLSLTPKQSRIDQQEVSVAAPKPGKLVSLPINVGDNVAGGDLVAEIE